MSILVPSGKKVTASQLESGRVYLNRNLHSLRKIVEIKGDRVVYMERSMIGTCTADQFIQECQHEATEAEITFLNKTEQ